VFEAGKSNPKAMFFIMKYGAYSSLSLVTLGMDFSVAWKKEGF